MQNNKRLIQTGLLSWFAMLGWDFLLHGGLLARFYVEESPFLLSPQVAFQRIPLGYFSFLLNAILLIWIMPRFELSSWKKSLTFGLTFGFFTWGTFIIGMVSISTIQIPLALAWIVGQTFEMGLGALVVHAGLNQASMRRVTFYVMVFVFTAFVMTIIMQSIGFVPGNQALP